MVELVVVAEHFGVVDTGLVLVEHGELAVDQRTVTASHRDEDLRDTAAQHFNLFVGDLYQRLLHRIEGLGEFGELVAAACVDRLDVGDCRAAAGVTQRLDEGWQLHAGDLIGATRNGLDPAGHRTSQHPCDQ